MALSVGERDLNARLSSVMRTTTLPLPTRRGLNREQAANYVGISPTKFDELVRDGRMPKAFRLDGRVLWDVRKLDMAFDALSHWSDDTSGVADEGWEDVDRAARETALR